MTQLPTLSYAGRYRLRKIRGGEVTFDSGWFSNLITDGGLDQFADIPIGTGGVPYLLTQAYVGIGTTPPTYTDTSLTDYLASSAVMETGGTNSYVAAVGSVPPYWRHVRIFTFSTGTVMGVLSEVGVGNDKDALFSHALITDPFGALTSVEVLADEGLQLAYELRAYINPSDTLMSITVDGNTVGSDVMHDLTIRPCAMNISKALNIGMGYSRNNISLYSGNIQSNIQIPLGSATSLSSYVGIAAYTPGSFSISFTQQFLETVGNYSVPAVRVSNQQCDFQIGFVPPIAKAGNYILTLTMTLSWGRYAP